MVFHRFAAKRALALVSFCFSIGAEAFDIYPEYQGINEIELNRIEGPAELDSEYQSQINAYTLPLSWEAEWQQSPRALDTSVGSITNQHFFIFTRAKFHAELSEQLNFQFTHFAQRDREIDQRRGVFELSHGVTPWLRINAYGEPDHYKRGNLVGFALLLHSTENTKEKTAKRWENRFYYSAPDFTRGNHNDQADRFVGLDPETMGLQSLLANERIFLRTGIRFDRSVKWNRPQEGREFAYEKKLAYFDAVLPLTSETLGLRLQLDEVFKGQAPLPASSVQTLVWKRKRLLSRISYQSGREEDAVNYELALMYAARHWIDHNGAHLFHQNTMPSATARIRTLRREQAFDHLQISLEATDFHSFGDLRLTPANQKHASLEERLQVAYDFAFRANASLFLAFNFDLDEWSGLPTFDGGNARFRADF